MDRIDKIATFYNSCKKKYDQQVLKELISTHKQVASMLNNKRGEYRKYIIIDLTISKPKYGEIISAMQTCIALKHLGFSVTLYIFRSNALSNHIFSDLINNDLVMKKPTWM